jgi:hypothetical protein
MSTIDRVISWKFNGQEGMCTREGVITKFPGGIPSQADQDAWTAEYLVAFPVGYDEWQADMQAFKMSRELENHITDQHAGVAGNPFDQAEYDAKVARRGQRP